MSPPKNNKLHALSGNNALRSVSDHTRQIYSNLMNKLVYLDQRLTTSDSCKWVALYR